MAQRGDDNWFHHKPPRDEEQLYRRALELVLELVLERGDMSISKLQIELQIGFYQAERLLDRVHRRLLN